MPPDNLGKNVCIAAILIFLLTGCGHKGPLMLPAPHVKTNSPPTPSSQNPDLPASQLNK
jgi:predicted small lipoprotein YifL